MQQKQKITLKYFLLIVFIFLLSSCLDNYGNRQNPLECKYNIEREFPNAVEIKPIEFQKWKWIVINKDSTIWYVETMDNWTTKITSRVKIFDYSKNK